MRTWALGALSIALVGAMGWKARQDSAETLRTIDADLQELPEEMRADLRAVLTTAQPRDLPLLEQLRTICREKGFERAATRVQSTIDEIKKAAGV